MRKIRVMVVDDSALIRALFCDVFDNAKGIEVCGVAANADEAREKIAKLNPDVLTLDNEMPGISGLEFLVEIMEERPMPVIMLSSLTQVGTGTEQRALELGAAHCFPKPISSSREQFDATVADLTDAVARVAKGEVIRAKSAADDTEQEPVAYNGDGTIVVLVCGAAGIDTIKQVLASYPAECPPTILVLDMDRVPAERVIGSMQGVFACEIQTAIDGMEIKQGRACLVTRDMGCVKVQAGYPPRLQVSGHIQARHQQANALLESIAETKTPALGGLLPGNGNDGAKGMQFLLESGGKAFVQRPSDHASHDKFEAVRTLQPAITVLKGDGVPGWVLEQTTKVQESG